MDNADLVVVGTYGDKMQAEIARSVLEAAKIDSMLRGESVRGQPVDEGYQVLVRLEDAREATEILRLSK